MNLLCDERVVTEILNRLEIPYERVKTVIIEGYSCFHEKSGNFYFEQANETSEKEF